MGKAASEPKDLSSSYDLEYRASEDDAWYSVAVELDALAQTLSVKYQCFPEPYEAVFSADGFKTEAQVQELVQRFRPLSHQLQDHECGNLDIGTTVCAAHGSGVDDLRFFDAVIEAVNRQTHSFAGREEECLCTFVLFWLHGHGAGTLTSANIASICTIEPFPQIDPRISAFAILAEEKITSSKSISVLDCSGSASKGQTSYKWHICKSVDTNLEPSQNRLQETGPSTMRKSPMWKSEDSGSMSNHKQWKNQDEDIGPAPCNFDGLATAEGCHFIPINNLEKDLIPSTIKKFIYKQTGILPQAFVFPRLLSDPFARGAIVVDCRKKFQIINEFLDNPNHLIVSSRGRPWVITEEVTGTVRTTIWNLIPRAPDGIQYKRTDEELVIVQSGTESYKRAKQLRDLFLEFVHHELQVCKKLVSEEKRMLRSFKAA
ncbi:hypothetical protein Salat_2773200 [Sesamum alatum]|uniref:SAWADEE domain-containing protein n=1 Tax=Sesamum alatum TaxID=300844 RepID=A0AAE1XKH3_9LAMI|nr:hypothetical protein Salat_2773200 [Sesamum alatum]